MHNPIISTVSGPDPSRSTELPPGYYRKWIGVWLGPLVALAMYHFLLPEHWSYSERAAASVMAFIILWWVCEAVPLAVTALIPVVAFPVLGLNPFNQVIPNYASGVVFLVLGGFVLALSVQRWGLHRRIALSILRLVGSKPKNLLLGFMVATTVITMWVANTATAIMMLPIGISVIKLAEDRLGETDRNFAAAVVLCIAFSATSGGMATLVSTSTTAYLAAYMAENHGIEIGFAQWMLVGVPVAWTFNLLTWFVLLKVFPPKFDEIPGGHEMIRDEFNKLGPMNRGEKLTLMVFAFTASAWIFRPLLQSSEWLIGWVPWIQNINDAQISIIMAVSLFLIPVNMRKGEQLVAWEQTRDIPWNVLLLYGGGLSLSAMLQSAGLMGILGEQLSVLGGMQIWMLIGVMVLLTLIATEFMSNLAAVAMFLPVVAGLAGTLEVNPLLLAVPLVLASNLSFMLPISTTQNTLAYGTGYAPTPVMLRAGVWLNFAALFYVTFLTLTLVPWVFGISW